MVNPRKQWHRMGFRMPPTQIELVRPTHMWRVWGGGSQEMGTPGSPGLLLSLECPKGRRAAEALLSIFEYGNTAQYVTMFKVNAGAPVWLGTVHPGQDYLDEFGRPGSQVFIEREYIKPYLRRVDSGVRLADDMGGYFVVGNKSRISN